MFTLQDLLDIAVKMEQNGEAIYRNAAKETNIPEIASLLTWMANEESNHSKWFERCKREWGTTKKALPQEEGILPEILNQMMGNKSLSLDDIAFQEITSPSRLMEVFREFETDTLLFYDFLKAFIEDPEAMEGLDKIIQEEKNHIQKLEAMATLSNGAGPDMH